MVKTKNVITTMLTGAVTFILGVAALAMYFNIVTVSVEQPDTGNGENGLFSLVQDGHIILPLNQSLGILTACLTVCPNRELNCSEWNDCIFHYPEICRGIKISCDGFQVIDATAGFLILMTLILLPILFAVLLAGIILLAFISKTLKQHRSTRLNVRSTTRPVLIDATTLSYIIQRNANRGQQAFILATKKRRNNSSLNVDSTMKKREDFGKICGDDGKNPPSYIDCAETPEVPNDVAIKV